MSLTNSPLGVFLITSIALGGVLDVLVTFCANGVSSFSSAGVCPRGRERQHWEGFGTYVFSALLEFSNASAD